MRGVSGKRRGARHVRVRMRATEETQINTIDVCLSSFFSDRDNKSISVSRHVHMRMRATEETQINTIDVCLSSFFSDRDNKSIIVSRRVNE